MIFGDRMRTPLHVLPHVLLQLALALAFLGQCTPSDVARTDAANNGAAQKTSTLLSRLIIVAAKSAKLRQVEL